MYLGTVQVVFLEVDNTFVVVRFRLQDCRDLRNEELLSFVGAFLPSGSLLSRLNSQMKKDDTNNNNKGPLGTVFRLWRCIARFYLGGRPLGPENSRRILAYRRRDSHDDFNGKMSGTSQRTTVGADLTAGNHERSTCPKVSARLRSESTRRYTDAATSVLTRMIGFRRILVRWAEKCSFNQKKVSISTLVASLNRPRSLSKQGCRFNVLPSHITCADTTHRVEYMKHA